MAESGWPRHALRIGVFEFRRTVRVLWQDKARFALLALGMGVPSLITLAVAFLFADSIREISGVAVPDMARGTLALFWLFGVYLIAQRVVSARPRIDSESLMLTTVSARTAAFGLLIAEMLRLLSLATIPIVVLTGVGVVLLDSLSSLILVPLVAVLFAATVVVAGSLVGYAIALLVATSPFVARYKTILGTGATLLAMGGYFAFLYPQISGLSQAVLAWFPLGWLADLAVVGTPFVSSTIRAVGVIVGSAALLGSGGHLIERTTVAFWFSDPVTPQPAGNQSPPDQTAGSETMQPRTHDALAGAVAPLAVPQCLSTPVRRVAEWALMRTRRDPNRLLFLFLPVFAIGSPLVSTAVQSGSIGAIAAPLCAVGLPWIAGVFFTMNPLGDEGPVLPVTLTAVSGTQYVRGLIIPGLVFGLPIILFVTGLAGLASPYTAGETIGLVVLSAYLTWIATTIAPAIGMVFPRFSAIRVGQSRDVLPPRMTAVAVHAFLLAFPGALLAALLVVPRTARAVLAGVFGFLPTVLFELLSSSAGVPLATATEAFRTIGENIQAVDPGQLQFIGGGTLLLGGMLCSYLLYQSAVRRFNQYVPR
jgi:ABC-2 type transport system permease protein